jgi:hypothetical protein
MRYRKFPVDVYHVDLFPADLKIAPRNFIFLFQSVGGLSPTSTTSSSSGLSSAGSSYPGDLAGHSPPLSESGSTRGKLHFAIFNKKTSAGGHRKERKGYRDDPFLDENVTFR